MIKIIPYSQQAALVQWEGHINKTTIAEISRFNKLIQGSGIKCFTETIPAFTSITICYQDAKFSEVKSELEKLYHQLDNTNSTNKISKWQLPILLSASLSDEILSVSKLDIDTFHQRFLDCSFVVGMKGFIPGFLYLAGLPEELHIPRKAVPDPAIMKGSVAIGGSQCGIYPSISPGGWNTIGNCPVTLIDIESGVFNPFQIGDEISFKSISESKHKELLATRWSIEQIKAEYLVS